MIFTFKTSILDTFTRGGADTQTPPIEERSAQWRTGKCPGIGGQGMGIAPLTAPHCFPPGLCLSPWILLQGFTGPVGMVIFPQTFSLWQTLS